MSTGHPLINTDSFFGGGAGELHTNNCLYIIISATPFEKWRKNMHLTMIGRYKEKVFHLVIGLPPGRD